MNNNNKLIEEKEILFLWDVKIFIFVYLYRKEKIVQYALRLRILYNSNIVFFYKIHEAVVNNEKIVRQALQIIKVALHSAPTGHGPLV